MSKKRKITYTFSGWLHFVKKMSEKEIDNLFDDKETWTKLQIEYEVYLAGLEDE